MLKLRGLCTGNISLRGRISKASIGYPVNQSLWKVKKRKVVHFIESRPTRCWLVADESLAILNVPMVINCFDMKKLMEEGGQNFKKWISPKFENYLQLLQFRGGIEWRYESNITDAKREQIMKWRDVMTKKS